MCGINGIALPESSNCTIDESLLVRMRDVQRHRGPDEEGIFVTPKVGLGHRRLSIVDLRSGQQPMFNDDRTSVIVYNGEVYDHRDSRKELVDEGVTFRTGSDTETVLRLYERHGHECVERLRGMFSFAIWDSKKRELFAARDRFGVKPFYYVLKDDGSFYFASEIKALIEAGAVRPSLNFKRLPEHFANHGTAGEETLFEGVKRLLPGHFLVWKDGRTSVRKYWEISFKDKFSENGTEGFVREWSELFERSVELRLMSDVPLGLFLSGGIDSSAICAAMANKTNEPIKTFSVGFSERTANEFRYARLISEQFKTDHHELTVSPTEFFDALPQLVWHEDAPIGFVASVPLFFVSKLASKHVKVVLTGEGSDETLAGYGRYAKALQQLRLGRKYEAAAPRFLRSAVKVGIGRLADSVDGRLGRTFLTRRSSIEELFLDNFAVFPSSIMEDLFTAETKERIGDGEPFDVSLQYLEEASASDELDRMLYTDIKSYLETLLMKQDRMSMAASIESRVPFLDHKLVEFSARLPERTKIKGSSTKWILRQAMGGQLPEEILDRAKMGFPVPFGEWVRGDFKHILDEYLLSERTIGRGIFERGSVERLVAQHFAGQNESERLWALLNFEVWCRVFLDGEIRGNPASETA